MYKLIAFDLDGVLVDIHSSWEYVHKHFGMNNDASLYEYIEGKIDDEEFMRRDIQLWKIGNNGSISIQDLERILSTAPLMNGASDALSGIRRIGMKSAIISGGLEILANRVARELSIDYVLANGVETDENGILTGEGISRVLVRDKGMAMKTLLDELGIRKEECIAVGNSEYDISMFDVAGFSIAFAPEDDLVRKRADAIVEEKDLREILKFIK